MKVFILKNCDTCRKAMRWLDDQGLDYTTHDIRAEGLPIATASELMEGAGRDTLVNRRSTTWRNLPDVERERADTDEGAAVLLAEHPTLMKRPVFVSGTRVYAGFDDRVKLALTQG